MLSTGAYFIHYDDVIMSAMSSQINSLTIIYPTVYSGADERKHQSSASLAFVGGIHRWPVTSPHKRPATRKMFPFDDVIMISDLLNPYCHKRTENKLLHVTQYNAITYPSPNIEQR